MKSKITTAITKDLAIRAIAIEATEIVEAARAIHNTSPVATAALGRALCGASMMGYFLKGEEASLTLQIRGDGPLGAILAVADSFGNVRGHVKNPQIDLPLKKNNKLDVGGAVGAGNLIVIKDLQMKEPYMGQVPLQTGEIAEDITHYFAVSEQTPTVCALGVLVDVDYTVKAAGGYFIQLMPACEETVIAKLEAALKRVDPVSTMVANDLSAEAILQQILSDFEVEILQTSEVSYACDCSLSRVERALISVGKKELGDMIAEDKEFEIVCQFCGKEYHFTPNDLERLCADAK